MVEIVIRLPLVGRQVAVPFLLQPESSSMRPALYPLFAPVGSMQASVSLPFGGEVADLRVAIGAIGDSDIQIGLRPPAGHLPAQLRLTLNMLDMAMATTSATAHRVRPGWYATRAFFSMPGIWRVVVAGGQVQTPVALIIGKPVAG
jgi:hypothetical protein